MRASTHSHTHTHIYTDTDTDTHTRQIQKHIPLLQAWEPLATELAGCSSDDEVARLIISLLQSESNLASPANPARDTALGSLAVLVGCDTRPSSPVLTQAACEGIQAMGVRAVQLGQVTTPQLHFQEAHGRALIEYQAGKIDSMQCCSGVDTCSSKQKRGSGLILLLSCAYEGHRPKANNTRA
eukprot:1160021-Pelagomonas_calceolata.AAC.6